MRIAITGATGFIGSHLVPRLVERGHEPVALTRDAGTARDALPGTEARVVDYADVPSVARALSGCDAVVNLAGANVFGKRWSKSYRVELRSSRVVPTRALVDAMASLAARPRV